MSSETKPNSNSDEALMQYLRKFDWRGKVRTEVAHAAADRIQSLKRTIKLIEEQREMLKFDLRMERAFNARSGEKFWGGALFSGLATTGIFVFSYLMTWL